MNTNLKRDNLQLWPFHPFISWFVFYWNVLIPGGGMGGGGGGTELPYITDGDARQNFQKKPLKVPMLGVAPTNFIP